MFLQKKKKYIYIYICISTCHWSFGKLFLKSGQPCLSIRVLSHSWFYEHKCSDCEFCSQEDRFIDTYTDRQIDYEYDTPHYVGGKNEKPMSMTQRHTDVIT